MVAKLNTSLVIVFGIRVCETATGKTRERESGIKKGRRIKHQSVGDKDELQKKTYELEIDAYQVVTP